MRAVELILGIPVPGVQLDVPVTTANFTHAIESVCAQTKLGDVFTGEVVQTLLDAVPVLLEIAPQLVVDALFDIKLPAAPCNAKHEPLVTKCVCRWDRLRGR